MTSVNDGCWLGSFIYCPNWPVSATAPLHSTACIKGQLARYLGHLGVLHQHLLPGDADLIQLEEAVVVCVHAQARPYLPNTDTWGGSIT